MRRPGVRFTVLGLMIVVAVLMVALLVGLLCYRSTLPIPKSEAIRLAEEFIIRRSDKESGHGREGPSHPYHASRRALALREPSKRLRKRLTRAITGMAFCAVVAGGAFLLRWWVDGLTQIPPNFWLRSLETPE